MSIIKKYLLSIIALWAAGPTLLQAQIINNETASDFAGQVGQHAGFSTTTNLGYIIASLISGFLALIALIFIVLMVLSGFRWMTSAGNEETIKKSQDTIKNSLIGLVIVLAAWAITYFVFTQLPFGAPAIGPQGGTSG